MRIIAAPYSSLDGVIQGPGTAHEDTEAGFTQGGWQAPYVGDGEVGRIVTEWLGQVDGLMMGRKTYDIFVGFWPTMTGPIAEKMNSLPKYLVSTTVTDSDWDGVTVLDSVAAIRDLRERPGGDLLIFGSGVLVGSLLDNRLLDELRVWTYPVVLGEGKRLFEPGRTPTALELIDSTVFDTGCVLNVYRPDGEPRYGDMTET